MSDSEENSAAESSENEVSAAEEEVEEDTNGLVEPDDDEDSDVTWEGLVRIDFASFRGSPRGSHARIFSNRWIYSLV